MFKPVSPKVDFIKLEKKLLKQWYQSGLVKKYLQRNNKAKKRFSFLDGPITANNPMGVHHAWGRTYKDLWQRFFNMKGFRQRFQNGFDNQGLWVEVEVEKELGFKSKKDIEKYGIAKFVNKCKERTLHFSKVQTEQSKRLGYFMDWDNSYYTMSDENNFMIWAFLKKCWQDGNLYKGKDSVPWCPRCGTAISQHEILQEEYQELTHKSVVIKFPTVKGEYLLAWTTTPWSIPGTIRLMVNPDFEYAKVKHQGEKYILAKDMLSVLKGPCQIMGTFKGKELIGRTFVHPYKDLPALKGQKFSVIPSKEFVTLEVGTGIVTNNPGVGHEDYLAAKAMKIEPVESIDEAANFLPGYSWLTGKNTQDEKVTERILEELKEKGFVYDIFDYTHRYPVCWRCKTELVFRMVDEWYIAMDDAVKKGAKDYRRQMIKVAKKIRWIPEWGLDRELDWLKNMQDWLISKKRYWGLALPIWECPKCGEFKLIGSKEEFKKEAVEGWKEFEGHTPHRPWIDKVKIQCSKCKSLMARIPDVGNPWLDAGIVSFSTLKYRTDKNYWRQWFPADFITESFPGQFKNWFYSVLAMATILENHEPFKTVFGYATLLAEDGRPMHKTWGNAIEFNEGADKIGVDVMRWIFLSQNPAQNILFGYHLADETRRRFHLMLWNVFNFFVTNASVDKWQPKKSLPSKPTKLDLWILTRLDEAIIKVTGSLEEYDSATATQAIEDFVQDLSTWYLRLSRGRVGPSATNKKDKDLTHSVLYTVLLTLAKVLAPFIPFLAEEIYQNLTGKESVHLTDWPEVRTLGVLDKKLLDDMELVRKICELGHAARKEVKIRVRQPLQSIKVKAKKKLNLGNELVQLIKEELNVKRVLFEKKAKQKEEIIIELDTKITPELKDEGEDRELIRQIQELRKQRKCRLDEKIEVIIPRLPHNQQLVSQATLTRNFIKGKKLAIKK